MDKILKIKYSQALQGFFLAKVAAGKSQHTINDYKNSLSRFQVFLERDYVMEDITSKHIEYFLAGVTHLSKKTRLNYHTALSSLWTWAIKERVVSRHVVQDVEAPKPEQREIVPFTEAEVKLMLNSLERSKRYQRRGQKMHDKAVPYPERNRAMIMVLVDTGIRATEACNIRIRDIDQRNHRIKVHGKGAKDRYVSFSARTGQAIWRYLATRKDVKDNDFLFVVEMARQMNRSRMLNILHTIGVRAGVVGVNVHRFRHTFAIQYLRNRGDPYTLQKMLGHSTLDMVKRYLAIAQSDVAAAHQLASPADNWAL